MVSLTFTSWNQIVPLLRRVERVAQQMPISAVGGCSGDPQPVLKSADAVPRDRQLRPSIIA
jgi:hypothetical protein